jgi:hypothetical protein
MRNKKLPPIEEFLQTCINRDHYVHLYDYPLTRLKVKYKGIKKNKYKNMRCLGAVQLTFNRKTNRFFMVLQFTFRLPYYNKSIYVKMPLSQEYMKDLIRIREELRPIETHSKLSRCRKLSPQTLLDDEALRVRLRAEREEKRKLLKDKKAVAPPVPANLDKWGKPLKKT